MGRRGHRRFRLEEGVGHDQQHAADRRIPTSGPTSRCSTEFTELTGINVNVDLVPEADYFTKLNTELAGGTGKHDAFMLGAYFI